MLDGGVEILLDTLSVEDVPTFGLNSVLGDVIADSANRGFANLSIRKYRSVGFAFNHKIGMTSHLSHACQPGELGQCTLSTIKMALDIYRLNMLE